MSFVFLKTANTDWPIHELLSNRWSPRAFDPDQEVSIDDLRSVLEAARWAASSFNAQPWRFIIARRRHENETFQKLLGTMSEFNQQWAKNASVLLLGVIQDNFDQDDGRPNPHAKHDLGQSLANLSTEATARGLIVHQMAGFDTDEAAKTFNVPDNFTPSTMVALGYQAAPNTLGDDLEEKERSSRSRRPQKEFVFTGTWDESFNP